MLRSSRRKASTAGRSRCGHVPLEERRLAQRHLEVAGPPLDQFLPVRRLDVVRLDLQQHLAVQVQRPLGRQPRDRLAEAAVGVAALKIVMQPGEVEPLLQRGVVGMLPHGVFVVRQGLAPAPLLFQLLPAPQHLGDLAAGIGDRDDRGKLRRGRSGQQREKGQQGRANCMDVARLATSPYFRAEKAAQATAQGKNPSSHGVVRDGGRAARRRCRFRGNARW